MKEENKNEGYLYFHEGLKRKNIRETHNLVCVSVENGMVDYLEAMKEWERNERTEKQPQKSDFLYTKMWAPKVEHREVYLKENKNGCLLLDVHIDSEQLFISTTNPDDMGNYLYNAVCEKKSIEELRELAEWDIIPEEDYSQIRKEWMHETYIACCEVQPSPKAGAAGKRALLVAGLHADAMGTLERCASATEIREAVEEFEELICPVPFTAAPGNAYKRHKLAWKLCLLMHKKTNRVTFSDWQHLVHEWGEVCKTLVGAEHMTLEAYKTENDDVVPCAFEESDFIEFNCSRVSLRGSKPLDLAGRLANLLNWSMMQLVESEQDGEVEWFYFKKREK